MEMKLSLDLNLGMNGRTDDDEAEGPLLGSHLSGSSIDRCGRCGRDIRSPECGGGVQVNPGQFICWECELPGEDLLDLAEDSEALEFQILAFERFARSVV